MADVVIRPLTPDLLVDWLAFFDHDAFADNPELAVEDADEVGSIVCFLVAKPFRGQGVAAGLLKAACAGFRARGLRVAEAYPSRTAAGDAANYHGPLDLYLRAGFKPYREVGESVIVRRGLSG